MSGTEHTEHSADKGTQHGAVEGTSAHPHEGHSHGVPPSFANPLGEAPSEESGPLPTDGAAVEALEVPGAQKHVSSESSATQEVEHQEIVAIGAEPQTDLPALVEEASGEDVTPTTKVTVLSADKWNEDYKVRVETLQQEIEELNIRLDQITAHKV